MTWVEAVCVVHCADRGYLKNTPGVDYDYYVMRLRENNDFKAPVCRILRTPNAFRKETGLQQFTLNIIYNTIKYIKQNKAVRSLLL